MDLTVQQLRVVVAVAEAHSFTAASRRLTLVQSSLSRTVAEVERQVGVRLFRRTTRLVVLTAEGAQFIPIARAVIDSFDRGMSHFAGFLDGSQGLVRIATLPSLAATLLPPIVSSFRRERPSVSVVIEDGLLGDVVERVTTGQVDFAVTVVSEQPRDLTFDPLATDTFYCVFPPGHPLETKDNVEWIDLDGLPFIAFDPSSSVRQHVDRATAEHGITSGSVSEARNVAAVGGLVAAGLGVTAVPGLVLPLLEFANLSHRKLTPTASRRIGILRNPHRPMSPATSGALAAVFAHTTDDTILPEGAAWTRTNGVDIA